MLVYKKIHLSVSFFGETRLMSIESTYFLEAQTSGHLSNSQPANRLPTGLGSNQHYSC